VLNTEQNYQGGCRCQSVRYQFTGQPLLTYRCHCLDCQLASGDESILALWVKAKSLQLTGQIVYSTSIADSGRKISRGNCSHCNSLIIARLSLPGIRGIFALSLDHPETFSPSYDIWTTRAKNTIALNPPAQCFSNGFSNHFISYYLSK